MSIDAITHPSMVNQSFLLIFVGVSTSLNDHSDVMAEILTSNHAVAICNNGLMVRNRVVKLQLDIPLPTTSSFNDILASSNMKLHVDIQHIYVATGSTV